MMKAKLTWHILLMVEFKIPFTPNPFGPDVTSRGAVSKLYKDAI